MSDENSAENLRNKTDEELSALLDQTLGEFSSNPAPPPRNTDDELDELMASADQEAAQKAAKDFQKMLEQMVTLQEEAMKKAETVAQTGEGQPEIDPNDPEALAMMDALKQLMECSSNVANASNPEEFMAGLDMLRSPNSPMEPFMSMIMQTLASKEVMYPPLKEIFDNYPKYLEDHGASLDAETKERYEKQYEVLGKICSEFEKQPEPAEVALQDAATEPSDQPAEPDQAAIEHFEVLGKLLVELQRYGYPPKELVGALPEGWQIDESGLPKVADAAAATEACTIM
ncbi:CBN-PRX-19 protein [Caenorhabditis brenneri]|uniref:Peroxin-19 n=1 Tax=Caenorhabditis brenneri TaxID=135651 RepID=G0NB64_CAEBE|nr:CBN-PRX-19 protein [Caenorhabditis brenneri]